MANNYGVLNVICYIKALEFRNTSTPWEKTGAANGQFKLNAQQWSTPHVLSMKTRILKAHKTLEVLGS